jgi:hypothetical protein
MPRRTYPGINAPWVAPGAYTVRLTVDGKSQTQPIVIELDPRVAQQIFTLTAQLESNPKNAASAYKELASYSKSRRRARSRPRMTLASRNWRRSRRREPRAVVAAARRRDSVRRGRSRRLRDACL